jgi:hypothetical protein
MGSEPASCCGLVPDMVKMRSTIYGESVEGRARDPFEWFPSDTLGLPCQVSPRSTLDLVPRGSTGGGSFKG